MMASTPVRAGSLMSSWPTQIARPAAASDAQPTRSPLRGIRAEAKELSIILIILRTSCNTYNTRH
jgi:hypothetical protein